MYCDHCTFILIDGSDQNGEISLNIRNISGKRRKYACVDFLSSFLFLISLELTTLVGTAQLILFFLLIAFVGAA